MKIEDSTKVFPLVYDIERGEGEIDFQEMERQDTPGIGRCIRYMPATCCWLGIFACAAGGVLWGTCNDPDIEGCSSSVKQAGVACVTAGSALIASLFARICCCRA